MRGPNEKFKNVKSIPLYGTWQQMIARCYHSQRPNYYLYGGRGIRVCEFFRCGPENLSARIGERPFGHTLERMDNEGHYSCGKCAECLKCAWPLNVRWATAKEQQRNTRANRLVTINGETHLLVEWAEKIGITPEALNLRLKRGGDPLQLKARSRSVTINGETRTVNEWAASVGISPKLLSARIRRGRINPLQPLDRKQQGNSLRRRAKAN